MTDPHRPILILLPPDFADWETPLIAGPGADFYGLTVRHATPGGGSVRSLGGLRTAELPDFAPQGDEVIVLCGSPVWFEADAPYVADALRAAHARGQTLAGICGGTLALARAGLLDKVGHTSNDAQSLDGLDGYGGASRYRDQPGAVSDGGIITAPGTAIVSFAAAVLAAAGVPADEVATFSATMAAEHRP